MKLIIDIPNDLYNKYKNDNNIDDIHKWNILSFIRKGIPLDKIRAEINRIEIHGQIDEHTMFVRAGEQVKQMALDVIDNYRNEVRK